MTKTWSYLWAAATIALIILLGHAYDRMARDHQRIGELTRAVLALRADLDAPEHRVPSESRLTFLERRQLDTDAALKSADDRTSAIGGRLDDLAKQVDAVKAQLDDLAGRVAQREAEPGPATTGSAPATPSAPSPAADTPAPEPSPTFDAPAKPPLPPARPGKRS